MIRPSGLAFSSQDEPASEGCLSQQKVCPQGLKPAVVWLVMDGLKAVPFKRVSSHEDSEVRPIPSDGAGWTPAAQGFMVGRRRTSLTKEVGAWVTSIATTWATSPGWIIRVGSLVRAPPPKWVLTEPGAMTETRTLY
jgi:hypothetical protein